MRWKRVWGKGLSFLMMTVLLIINLSIVGLANTEGSRVNRFNVVILLDASNSMNYTDENKLRYEAIDQFTNLLAEEGNFLGGVVFSNKVEVSKAPSEVTSQEDKQQVVNLLQSFMSTAVTADMGYTNIGDGLMKSVEMLEQEGEPGLPSAIVFLSDGNTEMPTKEEKNNSLDRKAEAIQAAREKGIKIYTVCLNSNHKADVSEMEQISSATGGEFREVQRADDLQGVFNLFYTMIYGTSTIPLRDDVFPESGLLETKFDIPGIGVEEVNVIINGETTRISLRNPSGEAADFSEYSSSQYTFLKIRKISAGQWTLITEGVPGNHIQINMIYNTNLGVKLETVPTVNEITSNDDVLIRATLISGSTEAISGGQYVGYEASLHIKNAYGEDVDTIPMSLKGDNFEVTYRFEKGSFFISCLVTGNHLEKSSENLGPIAVSENANSSQAVNQAPEPVEARVVKRVAIWPIRGAQLSVDMSTLVKSAENQNLKYKIVSTSFLEGKDFTVSGNTIAMKHFSLSTGSFDIKAINEEGLVCDIELIVKSYNVGILALLGVGAAGLIALLVIGLNIWYWTRKPFRGTVSAQSLCNGVYRGRPIPKKRGRIKLSAFAMDAIGLDYNKSYIQATGDRYVYLITDKPVKWNGQMTNKVRIQSGVETVVTVNEEMNSQLYIRFDSRMKTLKRR